ncbi:hypothetical protein [Aeromonas salmonicida]|uniref:Uncharacterized protein n=1 Tax=Aeromonas salmonicida TaxID=645 RepID=A0AAX3VRV9_AERSA|nr:hypothetical protein [Aeromonas salmonicida]WHF36681.1 hypothetical protein QLQ87_21705 [Aeromonas salmonicida]
MNVAIKADKFGADGGVITDDHYHFIGSNDGIVIDIYLFSDINYCSGEIHIKIKSTIE